MARPRQIDDTTLLNLIEQFFIHECKGNPTLLKKPEIAQYVCHMGYPGYAVTTLRRNKVACDYIDSLKAKEKDKTISLLSAYKTLDAENFVRSHRDKSSLIKALTELDCYYKTIVDSSITAIKEYKSFLAKTESLQSSLVDAQLVIQDLTETVGGLKNQIKELNTENERLKNIVEDYVYPDICNELLSQDKQLRNIDTIIDEAKLQHKVITFKSKINSVPKKASPHETVTKGSSVVQSLTDIFKEDE